MNNLGEQNNNENINNAIDININNSQIHSGIYECYANIDGFIFNKYYSALKQINSFSPLIKTILFLGFLENIGLAVFLFFNHFILFCLVMVVCIVQLCISIYSNQIFHTGFKAFSVKCTRRVTYFLLNFVLTLIQLDFILYLNFCKEQMQTQKIKYHLKINKVRLLYYNLISWSSQKKFFVVFKSYILLGYVVLQYMNGEDINEDFQIIMMFIALQFTLYLTLHNIYLQFYVFSKKLSIMQSIITFIESAIQLIQGYCYLIILFYNFILLITVISIILASFIFRFQQGFYDPFYVDFIQQVFMGQKLTYFATLQNSDINQQEMLFNNFFSLFQFVCSCAFMIFAQILVLYYDAESFPSWLILFQTILTSFTIVMICIKFYLVKICFVESKSYSINNLSTINALNLKRKCKLVLDVKYLLSTKNQEVIQDLINLETESLYIRFQSQFTVQIFTGYSLLTIESLESECLQEAYKTLLSKSNSIDIKYYPNPGYYPSKKTVNLLFSMLKQTSIEDQLKIDVQNCDLVTYFKDEKFYNELQNCLRSYNCTKVILNSLVFVRQVQQYQYLNSALILYDLYDF